jgi:hypothetical protein
VHGRYQAMQGVTVLIKVVAVWRFEPTTTVPWI